MFAAKSKSRTDTLRELLQRPGIIKVSMLLLAFIPDKAVILQPHDATCIKLVFHCVPAAARGSISEYWSFCPNMANQCRLVSFVTLRLCTACARNLLAGYQIVKATYLGWHATRNQLQPEPLSYVPPACVQHTLTHKVSLLCRRGLAAMMPSVPG